MGYRSDVAIGMAFPDKDALVRFVTSARLKGDEHINSGLAEYGVTVYDSMALLHVNFADVRWYDNYPDVDAHQRLLALATDMGAGTAFVRIGEEHSDIEVDISDGEGDYDLWSEYGVSSEVLAPAPGETFKGFMNELKEK